MTEKKPKKPLIPDRPPEWVEGPQLPPDFVKEIEKQQQDKKKQPKKGGK